jgi:ribonucleoside-diphosphate reductase
LTRRGAFAAYLDIDHPDFEEFLQIRDIGNPIQNLFTGACIPDYWMQEMVDGDMEKRRIWAKVLESRQQKGLPYLFFTDSVNRNKPQVYKDKKMQITHSNLCVAPYTKILTSKGYQVIGELEDQEVEVWNGEEWSKVTVKKTGSDQELVKVKLSSGQEIDCTPYHKFYVQVGIPGRGGKIVEKRAQELEEGDKLIKFDLPIIEGEETLEHAYDNGFFSGDGCEYGGKSKIYLYNKKRDLQKFFSSVDIWASQPNLNRDYGYGKDLKVKYFVPGANYTIESRLKWLAGLLDADGTSLKSVEGSCSLQIASTNQQFLRDLQLMLQTLGCHSKIALNRKAGRFMMPKNDGTGELKEYDCNHVWRIVISCGALTKLTELGLVCNRVKWNIIKEPNRGALRFVRVESKPEKIEGLHDTYCFTEPKRHMGVFNGALIGQCSEVGLFDDPDESFVCCLSSLNLELYDEWKNTDTVKLAIYFLDAVMSEFIENSARIPGLEAVNKFARRHRALGLGEASVKCPV